MRILLDTHAFLWLISKTLSKETQSIIEDANNDLFLSSASIWECIIKNKKGKLPFPESPDIYLPKQRKKHFIESLQIDEKSVLEIANLPQLHQDPFDRILICQALRHNLHLLTSDRHILAYPKIKLIKITK